MPIYRQQDDFRRLLSNLYYFNHKDLMPENWKRDLRDADSENTFQWLDKWGERRPLVAIIGFCLMPNHFHLILKELEPAGVSRFLHKISMGYSKYINEKYSESGSLFQGAYRMRLITDDFDLQYAAVYVMVKNPFELYPGGLACAIQNFDAAYEFSLGSPFNSLAEYAGTRNSPIIARDLLGDMFETPAAFKKFAHECMLYKLDQMQSVDRNLGL